MPTRPSAPCASSCLSAFAPLPSSPLHREALSTCPQGSPRPRPRRHEAQLRHSRRHSAPAGHQRDASVDGRRLDPYQQRRVQRRAGSGARRLRCWPLCFRPLCCSLCRCPVCHCRVDASAIYTIWCVWGANDWRRVQILVSSNFLSEIFIIVRLPDLATSTQLLCVCRLRLTQHPVVERITRSAPRRRRPAAATCSGAGATRQTTARTHRRCSLGSIMRIGSRRAAKVRVLPALCSSSGSGSGPGSVSGSGSGLRLRARLRLQVDHV
eukprot:COSAG04_NODE_351_length_16103_cov_3.615413_11_plen_267_part_00